MTINEFLIKKLQVSGKTAISLIQEKKVYVNNSPATQQQPISKKDEITFEGKMLQASKEHFYLAYYKPRGIECTSNKEISQNLSEALPELPDFFPVGRLDKDSEGLLLLTNDGKLYRQIAPSEALKEKEYLVIVDKPLTEEAIQKMSSGMVIMGRTTRPCSVIPIDDFTFQIILTQGLNRQIRRMCYKLGYKVKVLKRTRIMSITLGKLLPGQYITLTKEDILT
jgi:23S rRNA pseudouridine2604 synthase